MLVVHATVPVKEESREEALEAATTVAEESRKEEGVVDYRAAVDVDDKNLLRFFEQYEDEAAFGAHASSDHFAEFASKLPNFLDGEPKLTRFEVSGSSEVEL
jgi:quinol monooxygenase YgiN